MLESFRKKERIGARRARQAGTQIHLRASVTSVKPEPIAIYRLEPARHVQVDFTQQAVLPCIAPHALPVHMGMEMIELVLHTAKAVLPANSQSQPDQPAAPFVQLDTRATRINNSATLVRKANGST